MTVTDPHDTTSVPPGMSHERVGMFADAVFAIAMTLLVIEIPRPEGGEGGGEDRMAMAAELWRFLGHNSGSFLAFIIAFLMLWATWRQHHTLLDQIGRVTHGMVFLHIPLLVLVVLLPYPTALIGESSENPLSICLFAGTEAALLLCQAALLFVVVRSGVLNAGVDVTRIRVQAVTLTAIGLFWALTAGLTWKFDGMALAWMLTPVVAVVTVRITRRIISA
ncbi:TMEM175 family protein [Streptosporangium sp. CA-135522]|uniref:TMEM175 family protein n=1 Tax=Streptosporangium sp. CA-135522 TaxID=3240072 RepID=UPI003D927B6D